MHVTAGFRQWRTDPVQTSLRPRLRTYRTAAGACDRLGDREGRADGTRRRSRPDPVRT